MPTFLAVNLTPLETFDVAGPHALVASNLPKQGRGKAIEDTFSSATIKTSRNLKGLPIRVLRTTRLTVEAAYLAATEQCLFLLVEPGPMRLARVNH